MQGNIYMQLDEDGYLTGYCSQETPGSIALETNEVINLRQYSYRLVSGELVATDRSLNAPAEPSILADGLAFDSSALSISRIESAVMSLDTGDTIEWILHNNSIATVGVATLRKVLAENTRLSTTFVLAHRLAKDSGNP